MHLHWIVWSKYIEYFFQSIINFTANLFSCWLFSSSSDIYLWRHGVCRWTVQHIHCILNYKVKINHTYLLVMSESLLYEFIEKKIIFLLLYMMGQWLFHCTCILTWNLFNLLIIRANKVYNNFDNKLTNIMCYSLIFIPMHILSLRWLLKSFLLPVCPNLMLQHIENTWNL